MQIMEPEKHTGEGTKYLDDLKVPPHKFLVNYKGENSNQVIRVNFSINGTNIMCQLKMLWGRITSVMFLPNCKTLI